MVGALVRASHPAPTVAVTAFVTIVAAAAGRSAGGCVLVAAAVLTGQLSIGWCNDATDALRDRAAGRPDKPIVAGFVDRRTVAIAGVAAATATVPLSFANGALAGGAQLVLVAAGWAYNLGLKRTPLSWLAYVVGFGALPAFVTLGPPMHAWPSAWSTVAAALLGLGAHLANVLPDIAGDLRTGIHGMPQRLGPAVTRALVPVPFVAASLVLVLGPPGAPASADWTAFGITVVLATACALVPSRGRWRNAPFLGALVVAAIDVALFALHAGQLA